MQNRNIIHIIFVSCFSPNEVTYRGADELPWLNSQLCDKDGLKNAIQNLCIFIKLYGRWVWPTATLGISTRLMLENRSTETCRDPYG